IRATRRRSMQQPTRARARDLWITVALLALLFGALHPGVILRGEAAFPGDILFGIAGWRAEAPEHYSGSANAILSDPVFQYWPWAVAAADEMRGGEPPLWNRWNALGAPLLGNFQSGLFDPTSVGFLFLPSAHAWTLQCFLRFVLAGAFAYLFALHLGAGVA